MKTTAKLLVAALLLVMLYLGSYWVLIKKDQLARFWPVIEDPFRPTLARQWLTQFYKPVQELDWWITWDLPVRRHLTGRWRPVEGGGFVQIAPDGNCEFQLGEFHATGKAEYLREEMCFSMYFDHGGKEYHFSLRENWIWGADVTSDREVSAEISLAAGSGTNKSDYSSLMHKALPR